MSVETAVDNFNFDNLKSMLEQTSLWPEFKNEYEERMATRMNVLQEQVANEVVRDLMTGSYLAKMQCQVMKNREKAKRLEEERA